MSLQYANRLIEVARKKKNPPTKAEASSDEEAEPEADADDQDGTRRTKGGRKKSRATGEAGNDPYHSGHFAFAGTELVGLAATQHTVRARSFDKGSQ